jgi:hypothetical protein
MQTTVQPRFPPTPPISLVMRTYITKLQMQETSAGQLAVDKRDEEKE